MRFILFLLLLIGGCKTFEVNQANRYQADIDRLLQEAKEARLVLTRQFLQEDLDLWELKQMISQMWGN